MTLFQYFCLRHFLSIMGVFGTCLVLIFLLDFIEFLRRGSDIADASAVKLAGLSALRMFSLSEISLPFAVLVGAMLAFVNLSRRSELVVARAAGMSVWQMLMPVAAIAIGVGLASTMLYNPMSAMLKDKAYRLEAKLFGSRATLAETHKGGIWMRQDGNDGAYIVFAKSSLDQGETLRNVNIYRLTTQELITSRIEAASATLHDGYWDLSDVRTFTSKSSSPMQANMKLATNYKIETAREFFSTPETIPFWQLQDYITYNESVGLPATRYKLQYHALLARPAVFLAMVLIAASVSLRFSRFGGLRQLMFSGFVSGFGFFMFTRVAEDVGSAGIISPIVAAWLPALCGILIGATILLHQEDG